MGRVSHYDWGFPRSFWFEPRKECQTGQKQADLGKAIQRLRGNSLNFLTTQEGLWKTHNLEAFGRHL